MADIRFDCPHCQNHLVVEPEGAGLEVPCPHCGESIVIPEAAPPPAVEPPTVETISPPAASEEHHALPTPAPTMEPPTVKPGGSSLTSSLASSLHKQQEAHEERHSQDVNVDQPHFKKKDQWFYEKGRRYHFCYYDPHSPEMKTACEQKVIPVSADIAPTPLSKVKKSSFCKACLEALDLTVDDL